MSSIHKLLGAAPDRGLRQELFLFPNNLRRMDLPDSIDKAIYGFNPSSWNCENENFLHDFSRIAFDYGELLVIQAILKWLHRFSRWLFVPPCTTTLSWKQIVQTNPLRVFSIVHWNVPDAFFIPWGSLSNLKRPNVALMTQRPCAASTINIW